ncbi:hypothetical protein ABEV55_08440 [Aneurinibacillus thermoaerophilus]|uniref:hypothetical protein n=1 Tax=Aneurinibacillus thermoaerophilus TaxID=143495 RepID=UPI002E1B2639|nr:hypothetical protein [Aneurinibacillus thermoaerophilus]
MNRIKAAAPSIEGLNQLDTAVLLEKYTLLLGMLQYGSPDEKERVKKEFESLEQIIYSHVNSAAFQAAARQLGLEENIVGTRMEKVGGGLYENE